METEMTEQERLYRFHWLSGTVQEGRGRNPADALNRLGYGGGAVRALDYYESVQLPEVMESMPEEA